MSEKPRGSKTPVIYAPLPAEDADDSLAAGSRTRHGHYDAYVQWHAHYARLIQLNFGLAILIFCTASAYFLACHIVPGVFFDSCGCTSQVGGKNVRVPALPTHYTLPSGDEIPAVALGTAGGGEVGAAVNAALKTGYKHIDGAWRYGNEAEVGQAIKESGVPREELWLTSKLWNSFHSPEDIEPVLDETLRHLQTDYLDLYLIHWPIAFKKDSTEIDEDLTADPYPTWQKLEDMVEKGKVRNIGVSNFNIERIKNLTTNTLKVQPAVNQVELNYWNPQPELLAWSRENGMLLEAYSPLGSSRQVKETLEVPEIQAIAKELGITPAQAIISWHVQRGTIVLPKSVTPSRVEENFHVYALPDDLFDKLEEAATSHPPQRIINPSKDWGLDFDIFDDYPY